jgi:hypothetical protein
MTKAHINRYDFIIVGFKNDSLAKFAAKGWTCDVCLVPNEDDSDKCVACMCAKPGAKPSKTMCKICFSKAWTKSYYF